MLVVIAIIAVLVSIIVPVVGNSTTKAAAAANAANLRSAAASVAVRYLEDPVKLPQGVYKADRDKVTINGMEFKAPTAKEVKDVVAGGTEMTVVITEEEVYAVYEDVKAADFADMADNGKADGSGGTETPGTPAVHCAGYDGAVYIDNETHVNIEYKICSCGHEPYDHVNNGTGLNPRYGVCKHNK